MRMNKSTCLVCVFLCVLCECALASISRYIQPPFYDADHHATYPVAKSFGNRIRSHATATTNSNKIFIGTHVYQTSSPASEIKQSEPIYVTSSPPPPPGHLGSRFLYRKLHKFLPEKTTQFVYSPNYNYQTPAPFTTPINNQQHFRDVETKEIKHAQKWYPEEDAISPDIYYKAEPYNNQIKHNIDIIIPSSVPQSSISSKRPNHEYLPPHSTSSLKPPNIEYLPSKQYWDENGATYPGYVQSIDLSVLNESFKRAPSPGDQFESDLKRYDSLKKKPYTYPDDDDDNDEY